MSIKGFRITGSEPGHSCLKAMNGLSLALICLAIYLVPTLTLPLIRGEAMYALVPSEMLAGWQWNAITLNDAPYLDKPPLLYWLNLLAFKVFGVSDWAARVPTLALTVGEVWGTFLVGRLLIGPRAAWLGGFILLSSIGFFALHLQIYTDHLITLTLIVSLYALLRWLKQPSWRWVGLFHLSLVAGFLSKGLIGVGFSLLIGFLYGWHLRKPRLLTFLFHPGGLALAALLLVPWFVAMEQAYPGFWRYQLVHEHLVRFLGQRQPNGVSTFTIPMFWLFLGIWLMPWALLLPEALYRYFREFKPGKTCSDKRLLFIWAAVIVGVFTLSATRIENYSLPALPALALIIGWWLDKYLEAPAGNPSILAALLLIALWGLGMLFFLGFLEHLISGNRREFFGLFPLIKPVAYQYKVTWVIPALAILGSVAGWRRPRIAVTCYGVLALLFIFLTCRTLWAISPLFSDKGPGDYIRLHAGPHDLVVMETIEEFEQGASLAFYAGRHILLVQRGGLPRFGYPVAPPQNYLISPARLKELWYGPQRLFLLVDDVAPVESYLKEAQVAQQGAGKRLLVNDLQRDRR
jgi:4-amino-4-deoxy-L-arabinose transferase-like glycosyltransferase